MKRTFSLNTALGAGALIVTLTTNIAFAVPSKELTRAEKDSIQSAMQQVSSDYIYPSDPSDYLYKATKTLDELLVKEKKLKPFKLKKYAQNDIRAREQFYDYLESRLQVNPNLNKDQWLVEKALKSVMESLGDDYTTYLNKKEFERMRESMGGGSFGGVGIYIELDKKNKNRLTVVEPIPGTPAAKAGLKARDVIIAIDGKSAEGITIEGSQAALRGKVGEAVVLTVQRKGLAEPIDIEVIRDKIVVSSVEPKLFEYDNHKIGYLRLRVFGENTGQELERAMRKLDREGAQAYLLDLRNNGGGYITAAQKVCSRFLPGGEVVVTVRDRNEPTRSYDTWPDMRHYKPLVVLVNDFSASASEITAAALSEHNRASIVGVKTFGKGSVQKLYPLPDGGALKITTAHYLTPDGHDINKKGITPHVKIKFEGEPETFGKEKDNQIQKAMKLLDQDLDFLTANTPDYPLIEGTYRILDDPEFSEEAVFKKLGVVEVLSRETQLYHGYLLETVHYKTKDSKESKHVILDITAKMINYRQ